MKYKYNSWIRLIPEIDAALHTFAAKDGTLVNRQLLQVAGIWHMQFLKDAMHDMVQRYEK